MKQSERGFTLVELLIVITIITVLTTVILRSLNDARVDGTDGKIMAEMDALGKRALIEESQIGTFHVICGTGGFTQAGQIADLIAAINSFASTSAVCNSADGAFAVSAGLSSTNWCVDNTGARTEITNPLTTELACP